MVFQLRTPENIDGIYNINHIYSASLILPQSALPLQTSIRLLSQD